MNRQATLVLVLTAVVAGLWFAMQSSQAASFRAPETYSVQIGARLTEDERIEFGLRLLDREGQPAAMLLAQSRYFPLDIGHSRWLKGGEHICSAEYALDQAQDGNLEQLGGLAGVKMQIRARMHPTRNQVEFALHHQVPLEGADRDNDLSGPLFPRQRFLPSGLSHHRWLFSSALTFTVVFTGEGMMSGDSSLEDAEGFTDATRNSHQRPEIMRLIERCMPLYEPGYAGYIGSDCNRAVSDYCEAQPDAQGCDTYRRHLEGQDNGLDSSS